MSFNVLTQKSLSLFAALGGWRTVAEGVASRVVFLVAYMLTGQVLTSALVAVGGVWSLLILVIQPAIWSQYLQGGFRSAFNIAAIARRIRFNLGLTVVVGALGVVLLVVAVSGVFALLVGVLLTVAYAISVNAHLVGTYARATDAAALQDS